MPNFVSPGVFYLEKDISEYSPTLNSSIVGIVGFSSKGPTNKSTLITSPESLVRTFGKPSETLYGQGLEGAIEILEQTNQIYFVRVADSTAKDASAMVQLGCCPAVELHSSAAWGTTSGGSLRVQVWNNNGVAQFTQPKTFTVATNSASATYGGGSLEAQYRAVRAAVGGDLANNKVFVGNGVSANDGVITNTYICGAFAGSGAYIAVSAYDQNGTNWNMLSSVDQHNGVGFVVGGTNAVGAATGNGATIDQASGIGVGQNGTTLSGLGYLVQSIYPGYGYNLSTDSNGDTVGNSIEIKSAGDGKVVFTVNEDGVAKESFKVSLFKDTGDFIEDVINTGEIDLTSEVIKGFFVSGSGGTNVLDIDFDGIVSSYWGMPANNSNVFGAIRLDGMVRGDTTHTSGVSGSFIKFIEKTIPMISGTNGISTDNATNDVAVIGDSAAEPKTGIYQLDDDALNISIALVPGIHSQSVQNALITLAEDSQNFIALVSPPEGVGGVQAAIDWTNGIDDARTAAVNSSWAAVHWPHVKTYSVYDGKDRWLDPSIYAARAMVLTDNISDPWFAPAGFNRGRLTKPVDVEVKLNQGDRDALYGGGNIINPIVNFPGQGITIFGQRTTQRAPSALDRINIRRLMIALRKVILASTQKFVFEPNDPILWSRVQEVINPLLDDIRLRRGITDFKVVCDSTTNTPTRIDRNEMWCKVLLKPTKAAEVLVFEVNITSQQAKLG